MPVNLSTLPRTSQLIPFDDKSDLFWFRGASLDLPGKVWAGPGPHQKMRHTNLALTSKGYSATAIVRKVPKSWDE